MRYGLLESGLDYNPAFCQVRTSLVVLFDGSSAVSRFSSSLVMILACLFVFEPRPAPAHGFVVTVLGASGGLEDGNLSAYFLREEGQVHGVMLDAGTVLRGLEQANLDHAFDEIVPSSRTGLSRTGGLLHEMVQAYLISHAHLDHVAGLVAISPVDRGKTLYALPSVLSVLNEDLFNHRVWPNLTDRGVKSVSGFYHEEDLAIGVPVPIKGTVLNVSAYPLSHGGVESTSFLVRSGPDALLYLGDTGPDAVEHSSRLDALWSVIAPLLETHRLRGILIECSYDNSRPDGQLFGHLTPHWLFEELGRLQARSEVSMQGFPVLITHIKPRLERGLSAQSRIASELAAGNRLGLHIIIAKQGRTIRF